MRKFNAVDSSVRTKFPYCDEQHLTPIVEYEDDLEVEYGGEEDIYDDNETVDEEEYQYFDNDQYVIENRKRYIKPTKSREKHPQPTRANYIYQKKQVESSMERVPRKPSTKQSSPLSPTTSKLKVEPPRWDRQNTMSSYQRSTKVKKSEGAISAFNSLNALREKMFGNLSNLSKPPTSNVATSEAPVTEMSTQYAKPKRRNVVATEQIHHDSGDGPRVSDSFKMDLSELLKINESTFEGSGNDEIAANLVNQINSLQLDNSRKINDMERQKKQVEQYYPTSLNLENFRQQIERSLENDHQSQSSPYQTFPNHGFGSSNFLENLNFPLKKNSSTQTNLGMEDAYSSDHVFKAESDAKYDQIVQEDQNWNTDDVSNIVSSSKEDLSELRNLQKTKQMICVLINKEIEKIAKMKNLDMSVSRRFLLQDRESMSCSEDFRKTRLATLNNLQNEIKKLITLETVDE